MARKRKKKQVVKKPQVEKEYWEEIEITDPDTGKTIKQKVKVTRFKAGPQFSDPSHKEDFLDKLSDCKQDDSVEEFDD